MIQKFTSFRFLLGCSIALSASLMSFEYHVAEFDRNIVVDDWIPPIEQDTMVIVKYENKIPELPKPKPGPPKPDPEPVVKPNPVPDVAPDLTYLDSISWFDEEKSGEKDPVFIPTLEFAAEMPYACECDAGDLDCTREYMLRHFSQNLKYPREARSVGAEGKVYVEFIIDEHGRVSKVKAKTKVHPALDEEAKRVVRSLGCFEPGKQGGKKVRVRYVAPISFKTRN